MANYSTKRVLICPLDWGLGHATRCIPIIEEFKNRGCEVFIASSGQALRLLKQAFPSSEVDELPSYNPHYSSLLPMTISMGLQIPKFLRVIEQEHEVLERIIEERKIDLIVSDNRYGCWNSKVKSVFITHQINIIVPWYLRKLVNDFNAKCIARFSLCWIPDWPGGQSLAGELSRSEKENVRYIGPLSRFKKMAAQERRYDILAIISGPEPQRSEFEKILRKELINWMQEERSQDLGHQDTFKVSDAFKRKCLLVRGIPSDSSIKSGAIDEVDFLPATALHSVIEASDVIICRSGYSTIMDLSKIGKKAILVPTPGQTEQEYLARSLMKKGIMYSEDQHSFKLDRALRKAKEYKNDVDFADNGMELKQAIDEVL
jgi:hypothetical protein